MVQDLSRLDIRKILVVNLAGMGDLVMSSPTLRSLRKKFPNAHIGILILFENKDLLIHCPYINEIFVFKRKSTIRNILANLPTILKLRSLKFDIAINLYNLYSIFGALKIWFLFFIINPKRTLGRNTDNKGFFYNFKIEDSLKSKRHQVDCMLDVVKFLGAASPERDLEVWFSQGAEERLQVFLRKYEIFNSDIVVGMNPGSGRPSHRWPLENFAKLASELIKTKKVKIVLTGSKDERRLVEDIAMRINSPVIISCGDFNLEDLTVFIKRCNLFITNDTGPAHIVNALKRSLIVLSGGGPEATFPCNKQNCIIIKKEVSCSPCYKFCCKELYCLKAISPEEVLATTEKFI